MEADYSFARLVIADVFQRRVSHVDGFRELLITGGEMAPSGRGRGRHAKLSLDDLVTLTIALLASETALGAVEAVRRYRGLRARIEAVRPNRVLNGSGEAALAEPLEQHRALLAERGTLHDQVKLLLFMLSERDGRGLIGSCRLAVFRDVPVAELLIEGPPGTEELVQIMFGPPHLIESGAPLDVLVRMQPVARVTVTLTSLALAMLAAVLAEDGEAAVDVLREEIEAFDATPRRRDPAGLAS